MPRARPRARPTRHGATQPEEKRAARAVLLRLLPAVERELRRRAKESGMSLSAVVSALVMQVERLGRSVGAAGADVPQHVEVAAHRDARGFVAAPGGVGGGGGGGGGGHPEGATQFAIRVGERELFETPRIAGPSVRLNVTLDDGLPEHVYVHAAEALQRALVQLLAYEGAGYPNGWTLRSPEDVEQ
jgi:hypothetical protein